ncbi:thioredoxin reductase [Fusarium phyllophilum]|uniref:Thioredoxin reductase n=1 Tax=Fusarium phyllophilum TaxID=47803 RepID=A0A8H5MSP9_9HYPO|nr:thioredoxin reductase [Fusarium phyllophilum]
MWRTPVTLLTFALFLHSATCAPTPELSSLTTDYEVIVVGGGPSGLGALSSLGRIRRKALMIDSAQYRNAPTRLMHDVAGFDGVTPAYYRWSAMQQIAHYPTVSAMNGTVTRIQPEANYTFFTVSSTLLDGTNSTYTARKVILATGLRDLLPKTSGLQENFGKGIYWCPYCDGIEHADQSMGILGPLDMAIEASAEAITLNSDIVIFANGTDTPEYRSKADKQFAENSSEYLRRRRIKVYNRTITRITRLEDGGAHERDPSLPMVPEHDLFRVEFDDFGSMERQVLFAVFGSEQRSPLGEMLGVSMASGMMEVDRISMRTNVPGIYAVGDASTDKSTNVLHSLYTGKIAVVDINMELEREISRSLNSQGEIKLKKNGGHDEQRKFWTQMSGQAGEILDL